MSSVLQASGKRIYDLMLKLVAVPSVTGSDGEENRCARFIYELLAEWGYFRENPSDLRLIEARNDPLNRFFVSALVRAARPTKKTVILTGHFDVVDTDVCGPLRPWAFDPEEYTRRIGDFPISEDAEKDLKSGGWLFGRGVSDMKTGVAVNVCLLEEYAARRDSLDANVLLLLVPDEEGDSEGMRAAASFLAQLREEEGLDFLICVNPEPVFQSEGPAVYYGTIGKLMPLFLCVGQESHAGAYYEGLNSTLVASYLNISLDGAPDTAELRGEQKFQPWCCLHMRDMRDRYAVTLPERTALYYNCLTVGQTPTVVLEKMKKKASLALTAAFEHTGRSGTPRVLTVDQLLQNAVRAYGKGREAFFEELSSGVSASDERERNIEFLSRALDTAGEKGPLVVVGFVPPFYPPRVNDGADIYDRAPRAAAAEIRVLLEKHGYGLKELEVFQGITDLSYTGFRGDPEDLQTLASNTPLWGRPYGLPLSDLQKIDIPSVVMGPLGRDSHKITERVELNFSFNILPSVIREFISEVARFHENTVGN